MLAGCSGGEDPGVNGGEGDGEDVPEDAEGLIITQGAHTGTMDPQDFTGSPGRSIIFNAYEKLITLDFLGDLEPVPQLASDWERIEDELLRIELRDDVQWHNGDNFTPEDAAFSLNRVADPDFDATTRRELLNVSEAEVVDGENAVDLHLTTADPIIVQRLAFSGGVVQQEWIEENDEETILREANGTGPYQLTDFEPDIIATFERVDPEEYWDDETDLGAFPENITYIASGEPSTRINQLLAEESHIVEDLQPEDVGRVEEAEHAEIRDVETDRTMMLMMRYDVEPFSNLEFRQAMNHAVDREALVESVLEGYGEVTYQITPETWFGHNPDIEENPPYEYDPEQAEQLIEESGYAGEEIELAVPQGRYLKDSEVGQAIAGQIDSLPNITCNVTIRDWATHSDMISPALEEAPPFHFFGFGSAPADASIKIDRNFTCATLDSDFSVFCEEEIDELSEQAANTINEDEREEILQEANRVVVDDYAACVPMYFQSALYGVNTNVVDFTPIQQEEIYWFSMELQE